MRVSTLTLTTSYHDFKVTVARAIWIWTKLLQSRISEVQLPFGEPGNFLMLRQDLEILPQTYIINILQVLCRCIHCPNFTTSGPS